jgi:hypothetical protein
MDSKRSGAAAVRYASWSHTLKTLRDRAHDSNRHAHPVTEGLLPVPLKCIMAIVLELDHSLAITFGLRSRVIYCPPIRPFDPTIGLSNKEWTTLMDGFIFDQIRSLFTGDMNKIPDDLLPMYGCRYNTKPGSTADHTHTPFTSRVPAKMSTETYGDTVVLGIGYTVFDTMESQQRRMEMVMEHRDMDAIQWNTWQFHELSHMHRKFEARGVNSNKLAQRFDTYHKNDGSVFAVFPSVFEMESKDPQILVYEGVSEDDISTDDERDELPDVVNDSEMTDNDLVEFVRGIKDWSNIDKAKLDKMGKFGIQMQHVSGLLKEKIKLAHSP